MRRVFLIFLIVTGACAGLVLWEAGSIIRRERTSLLERLGAERLLHLRDVTRRIEQSFGDIGEDLRLAGRLVHEAPTAADRGRELSALLAVVPQYRLVSLYDRSGTRLLAVSDPRMPASLSPERFAVPMQATASKAQRRRPGEIEASEPLPGTAGWFRVFAAALPANAASGPTGAIALLVDTEPVLARELEALRQAGTRVLLIGPDGGLIPATDPLAALVTEPRGPLGVLLSAMRAGRTETLPMTGWQALALDLSPQAAVAACSPIRLAGGRFWSMAIITSASQLAPEEQALLRRVGQWVGGVLMALAAIALSLALLTRRAVVLGERLRHAEQLAHLHDKTEKILDNVPTGVMALSEDERITALNRVLRDRVPASAVGLGLDQAFPNAPSAARARLHGLVDRARLSGHVRSLFGERLTLFGEEGQYSVHAVPLEPGFPEARMLLVIEDLSELRALTAQLLRAEKLATVGVLAAGIAHEIGTPLGVVRGRAEYIAGKLGPLHPQSPGMQVIMDQIDHVIRTIRQLLDFARTQPAAVHAVSVAPMIHQVLDLLHIEVERRGLSIAVDLPSDLPELAADPDQVQQVLVNLILNACDASDRGGAVGLAARTEASAGIGPSRVRLSVKDTGCGIPEDHLNQIFDPFFTTKKRGLGTGLGLTVAAQIVRNHGGHIEIESAPGRGTIISVLWPITTEEGPHAGQQVHPDRG